jgi:hypothetical protein
MSVDDADDATSLTRKLVEVGPEVERSPFLRDDLVREAVAALRACAEVDRRVARAFDALMRVRYDDGSPDDEGDQPTVVDAMVALDRSRTDLFRVLRAWMGEAALAEVAPVLTVDRSAGNPVFAEVHDGEFRMVVPLHTTGDEALLMAEFVNTKRQVAEQSGGDFGPDGVPPRHYKGCPGVADPEDCTCLSTGSGR